MNICFPPRQWRTPVILVERLSQQKLPGVRADLFVVFTLIHRVPVAGTSHGNPLPRDANEAIEKFRPLKVVLGAIPAAHAIHQVRQQTAFQ